MNITELYLPKIGAGLDRLPIKFVISTVQEMTKKYSIDSTMVLLPSDPLADAQKLRKLDDFIRGENK
jgi:hypothetical protein